MHTIEEVLNDWDAVEYEIVRDDQVVVAVCFSRGAAAHVAALLNAAPYTGD